MREPCFRYSLSTTGHSLHLESRDFSLCYLNLACIQCKIVSNTPGSLKLGELLQVYVPIKEQKHVCYIHDKVKWHALTEFTIQLHQLKMKDVKWWTWLLFLQNCTFILVTCTYYCFLASMLMILLFKRLCFLLFWNSCFDISGFHIVWVITVQC